MDYAQPIEAVIPGVQGRVLGVLARTEAEMTIRTAARLAGVSAQQATVVVNRLVALGLVTRREAGSAALVALDRESDAARAVLELADLRRSTLDRLGALARAITPAPASLIVFGSFARGEANAKSDLDVLAVRGAGVAADAEAWLDALGVWERAARHVTGNPVELLVVGMEELPLLLRDRVQGGLFRSIESDGVILAGSSLAELAAAA
ncbi:MAG: MarR family transcriptional regulator [Actinomycetota bacterium]|nr:MarR family transcriptional regulator [Actinomycetota bacterium]